MCSGQPTAIREPAGSGGDPRQNASWPRVRGVSPNSHNATPLRRGLPGAAFFSPTPRESGPRGPTWASPARPALRLRGSGDQMTLEQGCEGGGVLDEVARAREYQACGRERLGEGVADALDGGRMPP